MKFGQRPCTIVQGLWPDFEATLKSTDKKHYTKILLEILQNNVKLRNINANFVTFNSDNVKFCLKTDAKMID